MSKDNQKTDFKPRSIRSFVMRTGRLTEGQASALERVWPKLGLEHDQDLVLDNTFENPNAPLVVEVGYGTGDSLVEMAKQEPEKNFIGIEVHTPGVGRLLHNAETEGLTNLRTYKEDAVQIFENHMPEKCIDRMQLYFPDPWHKKRHHKRRIVQPNFVEVVRKKLKIGGVWHMATDWENYAEHMLEVMNSAPGFKNLSADNTYVEKPDYRPHTKFEARGERLGHGVWDLIFERVE